MTTSITIKNIIVHKLLKEAHAQADIELRPDVIEIQPTAQRLVDSLCKSYSEKVSKGFGRFEEDENSFPMSKFVREYYSEEHIDFLELSSEMMRNLKSCANVESLATGGYVLIVHIEQDEKDSLLIAVIKEITGISIADGMEIVDNVYLDLSHLKVAGLINMTSWKANEDGYIGFLKGRGEIANYFKKFLGCNDVVSALQETQKLIDELEKFYNDKQLNAEERTKLREKTHLYLSDLGKSGEPINLESFANHLWSDNPTELLTVLADENLRLSDGFIPDRRAIKGLTKIKGESTYWKLEFDRKALRNGEVKYDKNSETLTLLNIQPKLRELLQRELLEEDE